MRKRTLHWQGFAPAGGGSFNAKDMGTFCKVSLQTFVVPLVGRALEKITDEQIDEQVHALRDENDNGYYVLKDGKFIRDEDTDWEQIFKKSV